MTSPYSEERFRTRDRACAEDGRLLTLLGPGGMGKTRLAIRFGTRATESWPGGAFFCDLTEARGADGVLSAVAVGLGVQLLDQRVARVELEDRPGFRHLLPAGLEDLAHLQAEVLLADGEDRRRVGQAVRHAHFGYGVAQRGLQALD